MKTIKKDTYPQTVKIVKHHETENDWIIDVEEVEVLLMTWQEALAYALTKYDILDFSKRTRTIFVR